MEAVLDGFAKRPSLFERPSFASTRDYKSEHSYSYLEVQPEFEVGSCQPCLCMPLVSALITADLDTMHRSVGTTIGSVSLVLLWLLRHAIWVSFCTSLLLLE